MTARVLESGVLPCKRCGKPHDRVRDPELGGGFSSWRDPQDGHPYHPYSWETVALAFADEHPWPSPDALAAADTNRRKPVAA